MMRQRSRWKYQQFLHNLSLIVCSKLRHEPEYCLAHSSVPLFQKNLLMPHTASSQKKATLDRLPSPIHPRLRAFSARCWPVSALSSCLLFTTSHLVRLSPLPTPDQGIALEDHYVLGFSALTFPQDAALLILWLFPLLVYSSQPSPGCICLAAPCPGMGVCSSLHMSHHPCAEVWRNPVASNCPPTYTGSVSENANAVKK